MTMAIAIIACFVLLCFAVFGIFLIMLVFPWPVLIMILVGAWALFTPNPRGSAGPRVAAGKLLFAALVSALAWAIYAVIG